MKKQAHILVSGRVQGVNFRAYTQKVARGLGLQGYVRNLLDGRVEIVAEGEEDSLNRLIEWAGRGPSLAEVQDVRVEFSEPTDIFRGFSIQY